jgi:hypothetical protein
MVAAVADKCRQKLAAADKALVWAAMRCVGSIREVQRTTIDLVARRAGSDSVPLKYCAMRVGAKCACWGSV